VQALGGFRCLAAQFVVQSDLQTGVRLPEIHGSSKHRHTQHLLKAEGLSAHLHLVGTLAPQRAALVLHREGPPVAGQAG
jgi:hypothetical protein